MKAVNRISQILAIVFSVAAVVLFFFPLVNVTSDLFTGTLIGGELAFGKNIEGVGELYKSTKILFCFVLSVAAVVFSALTFKFKPTRFVAPATGLFGAIFTLVIACSRIGLFVDSRPLGGPETGLPNSALDYTIVVWLIPVALFVAVAFGVCHLIVDDRIMFLEGKVKMTLLQRIIHTLRDYKSEVKKIVWPGLRDVVKNGIIVLIMCGIVGIFIWLVDFGLGSLMDLITKL